MIDIHGLNDACAELHKRLAINIEIQDTNETVVFKSSKKNISSENKCSVITPRTNKNYLLYAISNSDTVLDNTAMQLISAYIEPYLSVKNPTDLFRDFIYGKISSDIFSQLLASYSLKNDITFRLYLIRCNESQSSDVYYIIEEMADSTAGDILFKLNDENIILLKECSNELSAEEADELANALQQSISFEIPGNNITISISEIYTSICQIKKAYESAENTLRLGSICTTGKNIFIAEKLRIETFLDMLPLNILREFLALYSGDTISEAWDDKMIDTVQALFDNNLNLSVTARKLYTHRNTLAYRLEKIKKISGFDLKSFDDAVMFKILMAADKLLEKQ